MIIESHWGHPYSAMGGGEIQDTVRIAGPPEQFVSRRVRLFDKTTGGLVAATHSAADGAYQISDIALGRYYIALAEDHEQVYHPAALDYVTATPMEG